MVDDSGKVVIRSTQDVNTALNDGVEDARLAGSPAELLVGH